MKRLWIIFGILLFASMIPAQTLAPAEMNIEYFYAPGCHACEALEQRGSIDLAINTTGINIEKLNVMDAKDAQKLVSALTTCGEPLDVIHAPTIFVEGKCYIGVQPVENKIYELVDKAKQDGHTTVAKPCDCEKQTDKFELTAPVLFLAAIADSVNPCAFAVLILLMSTILVADKRKKALFAGIAFSSAIFISYFLMGIGLFSAISAFGISVYFYKAVGVLAIFLGLFNLKDFIKIGSLGFVMEVPVSWRPTMKKIIRSTTSVPGAFLVGIVVSLFLTPCTSGPYIVIIGMLANSATTWLAVPLLLIYNIVFILPMLIIIGLVYLGMTTPEKAEKWRKPRTRYMHLFAGLLMIALGVIILVGA